MELLPSEILEQIFERQDRLSYRLVCIAWSQFIDIKYITSAPKKRLESIPLTPFIIQCLINIPNELVRRDIILHINNTEIIKVEYVHDLDNRIGEGDLYNYLPSLIDNLGNYRIFHGTGEEYIDEPCILLILDLLAHKAIRCICTLPNLVEKGQLYYSLGVALTFFRGKRDRREDQEIEMSADIIACLMKTFPVFKPTFDEITNSFVTCRLEEEMESFMYIMENGWYEKLEEAEYGQDEEPFPVASNGAISYLDPNEIYAEIKEEYLKRKEEKE